MLVSQGQSSHISSRSQVGGFLTLVEWCMAAGAALVTFVTFPGDGVYRTTAGSLGVLNGVLAVGTAGCGLGVAGATGAVAGDTGAGLTGNIPCEGSGVAGATSVADRHVWLDSIWIMFMDVVICMSVLASANDLNQV